MAKDRTGSESSFAGKINESYTEDDNAAQLNVAYKNDSASQCSHDSDGIVFNINGNGGHPDAYNATNGGNMKLELTDIALDESNHKADKLSPSDKSVSSKDTKKKGFSGLFSKKNKYDLTAAAGINNQATVIVMDPSVQRGHIKRNTSVPQEVQDLDGYVESTRKDDGDEVALLYSRHEKIPMKDFAAEIRASMDVENFLNQAILLLDLHETSVDSILDKMLSRLINKADEPNATVAQAKKAIFIHDSVQKLAKTIQGTCHTHSCGFDYDQSWICILCTMPTIQKRHVAIARLHTPANLGRTCQEIYFIILVVAPTKEKGTKNALETGRTFATLFGDLELRQQLLLVNSEDEFKRCLWEHTKALAEEQGNPDRKLSGTSKNYEEDTQKRKRRCCIGQGIRDDLARRLPYYWSDYVDGVRGGYRTITKTMSTTIFLYFAILLPAIAFGMLNDNNTHGKLGVQKVIYSQVMGGMCFALISGQPMTIVLTTAPLAIFSKVIYSLSDEWGVNFFAMYACVGLWNMAFLLIYALIDLSKLMKWSTRSTEEIFALFISIAFTVDSMKDLYHSFEKDYNNDACAAENAVSDNVNASLVGSVTTAATTTLGSVLNTTGVTDSYGSAASECLRENSLLWIILMFGTLWIGTSLYNFTKTPYLNANKRELLADYALPVAVIVMAFFGSYVFQDVTLEPFNYVDAQIFNFAPFEEMTWVSILGSMGLGFCLSLLFFMDQNISSAMVNSPGNKLKKGPAYHWDLVVIGVINGALAVFGLPMVHGALPHSPLHVRAMADVEDYVEGGHVYQKIVRVRETRLTAVFSHILIGLSLFLLPYPLSYIPRPVLDGLFLYLAVNPLGSFQMFERILLLVTEQAAYPPHHYIRSVPQRKVHLFTFTQLLQLLIMCGFGFSPYPYMKMTFPILLLLLLPIRHKLIPMIIEKKYLDNLDAAH